MSAPAYPHPINGIHHITHHGGLTKREMFAAMAMQGLMSHPDLCGLSSDRRAAYAVECADDLLAELAKDGAA